MSTLEAAAAFSGPRYAPEDPTLPPPWKGLIDGSTAQQIPQSQTHGQQIPQQQFKFQQGEEIDRQPGGNQIGYPSSSQVQQSGVPSIPGGRPPVQTPQMGVHPIQQQQTGGASYDMHQNSGSSVQLHQTGSDAFHWQQTGGSTFPTQTGQVMVHSQLSSGSPIGLKTGLGGDQYRRAGNEFYSNSNKDGPDMMPTHPKLAAIPLPLNQQDKRINAIQPPNNAAGRSGGLNIVSGPTMPNMYNHAVAGQPFPNAMPMRPPLRFPDPSNISNMSAVEIYRQEHEVSAMGKDVPAPFITFEATGFPPEILRELHLAGFSSPTPIQAQTWPVALQGRDIVAVAKTGSGKTLGYLLPAFMHLRRCRNNPQIGPSVLVLAPTRELATQIQDEAIKFGQSSRISCACLYGGAPKGPQLREIERGVDIVVATPGRLNDILEMRKINFSQVSFLVLDEADRMLDMGFEPQIRTIVNEIPPHRQTLMYTATWPKEMRKIAGELLLNPVQVNIGNVDELAANKAITQYVEVVPHLEKQRRLEQILRTQERGSKIIIFCSTKKLCDQIARSIGRSFGAAAIHGDKSQDERDWVLNQFRSGKSPILVATDVAARGLDIKDIRIVINYDFPTGIEDYVHRIGRTGRAGATGISYTFISDQDWKYAPDLVKVLEGANQRVPVELRELAARGGPAFPKSRGGVSRWDSSGGSGGGRWDSGGGGRGMRENNVGGGGGSGRWDSGGGRGRGNEFSGGRGGRGEFFGGRGNRGRGFSRNDRGPPARFDNSMDGRGGRRPVSSGWDVVPDPPVVAPGFGDAAANAAATGAPGPDMSPMSPGPQGNVFPKPAEGAAQMHDGDV
ncbi:DEAD-box ATP-dependent RNA helicase 40 [Acorus gramineus]|uniref:RNA helicase n=1 Tax=Acorus gramineus TaxID=55184 RepID=A0AAV9BST1_ACOGR|nr:DEAD-box ATP-dependent RNA helicase 40 [Acorus gramineus]